MIGQCVGRGRNIFSRSWIGELPDGRGKKNRRPGLASRSLESIGVPNGNTTTNNISIDEFVKRLQTIEHGKRKKSPPAKIEQNPSKIKSNYNDENELEESLDTEIESSNTTSTSYSNSDNPKNKQTEGDINHNTKQPPIVILLNENHTVLNHTQYKPIDIQSDVLASTKGNYSYGIAVRNTESVVNGGARANEVLQNNALESVVSELSNCPVATLDKIILILKAIKSIVTVDFKNRDVEQLVSNRTNDEIDEEVNERIGENIITANEPMQKIIDEIPSVTETKPSTVNNEKGNERNNIRPSSLSKSTSKYNKSKETVKKIALLLIQAINLIVNAIKKNGK
ncbi:hypothetical protein PV326_010167 [Microctonus aethiopoides]|nr:hypothetical protein PV326_010167 [Microctonus aethiopoides]